MKQLQHIFSDEQVDELARAREVKYIPFKDNEKGLVVIGRHLYIYKPGQSYHLTIENYRKSQGKN